MQICGKAVQSQTLRTKDNTDKQVTVQLFTGGISGRKTQIIKALISSVSYTKHTKEAKSGS